MSTQTISVLLVGKSLEDGWLKRFQLFLADFGTPDLAQKTQVMDRLQQTQYDLIILDEITLLSDYSFIQRVRQAQPASQVIVVTDVEDWRRARQAFQYGAADYVTTMIDPDNFRKVVQDVTSYAEYKGER